MIANKIKQKRSFNAFKMKERGFEHINCSFKIIFLLFFIGILWGSCDDDGLTMLPEDAISAENFWSSSTSIEQYVNQFYPNFRRSFTYWGPSMYYDDGGSDNMAPRTDITQNNDRIGGLTTIHSGNGNWNTYYKRIRDVNICFKQAKEHGLNDNLSNRYLGEARFFRAYFYYQLLRAYGGVPIITEVLSTKSTEELQKGRALRNEVVNLILADLDSAIAHLPPKSETGGNRLNIETALQFKSRVALYEGTWEKYHQGTPFGVNGQEGTEFLKIAAEAVKKLINMGTISLAPNYSKIFNQNDLTGMPGILLWKKYSVKYGVTAMVQRRVARHGGGTGLTRSLVRTYLMDDGTPIALSSNYKGDATLEDVIKNRDPRLDAILKVPGDTTGIRGDGTYYIFDKPSMNASGVVLCTTGYSLQKGANPNEPIPQGAGLEGPAAPLFRYAEALLNYAEAKAELGMITQQDLDISINKLRDRVNMPHILLGNITTDPNWNFPNLSPIINEVRRERRVELACEGYRLDDILRWAAADELIIGKKTLGYKFPPNKYPDMVVGQDIILNNDAYVMPFAKKYPDGFQFNPARDYLLAIPESEITLNPNLEQNPGWE